jgi:hypothetical protein
VTRTDLFNGVRESLTALGMDLAEVTAGVHVVSRASGDADVRATLLVLARDLERLQDDVETIDKITARLEDEVTGGEDATAAGGA